MVPHSVLFVSSSPQGSASHSVPIARAFVESLGPEVHVDWLDVFDLKPFSARHAEAKMAIIARQPIPARAAPEWAQVQELGERVRGADTLVFAVPMWNGGIPWALKLFVDTVTQPGIAFRFDPATGYHGLLGGRRAVVVYASRVFAPGVAPAFGSDHQSTYLRWWLEFCGITEVHELRLQPTYPTADFDARRRDVLDRARELGRRLR
jgi:FMN-dependent NADH-azoreductase